MEFLGDIYPRRLKATYIVSWEASVASVTPDRGPNTGATPVTITGTNFTPNATVVFGTAPATNVTYVNPTTLTAITPPGTIGPVDVRVIVNGQEGSRANAFTYVLHPAQIMSVVNNILQ
jgi:hypothetical protein